MHMAAVAAASQLEVAVLVTHARLAATDQASPMDLAHVSCAYHVKFQSVLDTD